MSTRYWSTVAVCEGSADTINAADPLSAPVIADLSAAFQQQAAELAQLADKFHAALTPDRATLDALAQLADAVRAATSSPRRLRALLAALERRRCDLHTGLAAVCDAVTRLLATGRQLLAHLANRHHCRHHRTHTRATRCAPIAAHMAAHAPPAAPSSYATTHTPGGVVTLH